MNLTARLDDLPKATKALRKIEGRTKFKHLRIAINAAMGQFKNAAATGAPSDTGLMKKSMRIKVKIPDASYNAAHHGKPAYGMMGVGRGIVGYKSKKGKVSAKTQAAATKAIAARGGKITRKASRYVHIVEKKSKFMEKARRSAEPSALQAFRSKLAAGLPHVAAEIFAESR